MSARTQKEIADEIERLGGILRDTSISILTQPNVPQIPGFVCSFIRYQATQAFRISKWLRQDHVEDVDLVAHATRGLFESSMIYGHLMKGGGKSFMQRLIHEVAADHFDILKSVAPDEEALKRFPPEFIEQYQILRKQKLKKTPPVRELVTENGAEREYRRFYAHYSKYSHPSLYQIAGDYREVYSQQAVLLFAERAVAYLKGIIEDTNKIRDLVLEYNRRAPSTPVSDS